jgi:hypothetical protein
MKIFVDENIPLVTVKELRAKGFDVADIRGSSEQGMPDEELWLKVQEEKLRKNRLQNHRMGVAATV